jgi:hypothetical protein
MTYKRMKHFFDVYNKVLQKYKILPNMIFNCGECGVVIDAPARENFSKKGKRRVLVRASGNRTMVTLLACGSATGTLIPPTIAFPGRRLSSACL